MAEFSDFPAKARTIREIALAAGVSTATVSRVMNNPDAVKKAKREAVLKVIAQNEYVHDGRARALSSGRTLTIGLVIPTITNSIYASSTQAIQRLAQAEGYSVILVVSDFDLEKERELIQRLAERRVDGIILTGGDHHPDLYRMLERNRIPFILTWKLAEAVCVPSVTFDNYAAGRLAMKQLIDLGHRDIGLICGRTNVNDRAMKRRQAYIDALADIGIVVGPDRMFEGDFEFTDGQAAMQKMLDTGPAPSAVFAANDILAIGAMAACRNVGLTVPDDISIMGFDDLPIAQFCHPKLSTIHVPATQMGEIATRQLIRRINGEDGFTSNVLPVSLVMRESVTKAKIVIREL